VVNKEGEIHTARRTSTPTRIAFEGGNGTWRENIDRKGWIGPQILTKAAVSVRNPENE
jgi:hypothetical protein